MPGRTTKLGMAASVYLAVFLSFALGQTGSHRPGAEWDPIHGFSDGNSYPGATTRRSSSTGSGSVWSSYQGVHTPTPGYTENPATIGGIVVSGGRRQCAGLFRMANC
jgi:hypothetical protein